MLRLSRTCGAAIVVVFPEYRNRSTRSTSAPVIEVSFTLVFTLSQVNTRFKRLALPLDLFEVCLQNRSVIVLARADERAECEVLGIQFQATQRLRLVCILDQQ